ncbi:hypothetical protein SDC9_197313 [bioreactor metagenome]|uniref:Uncharacterized protein n=1 Tax=bioreactor metagenome TaxID=1076179 RepID=A0A645IED9_9ZZZZ
MPFRIGRVSSWRRRSPASLCGSFFVFRGNHLFGNASELGFRSGELVACDDGQVLLADIVR